VRCEQRIQVVEGQLEAGDEEQAVLQAGSLGLGLEFFEVGVVVLRSSVAPVGNDMGERSVPIR
jgi:hypothetical protein